MFCGQPRRRSSRSASPTCWAAGWAGERPSEQWLYKPWDGETLIDLIFEPAGVRVSDELLERGEELNVGGMLVRVMTLDDILATKLLALDEHTADYRDLLQIARALREQVDWPGLRRRTSSGPFAIAFFALAEGLGIEAAQAQDLRGAGSPGT